MTQKFDIEYNSYNVNVQKPREKKHGLIFVYYIYSEIVTMIGFIEWFSWCLVIILTFLNKQQYSVWYIISFFL